MKAIKDKFIVNVRAVIASIRDFLFGNKGNYVFALSAVVLFNIVFSSIFFKIDLTGRGSYSLSEASLRSVSSLEDPMIVKIFFSSGLASPYNGVKRYLEDIISEYADESDGRLRYEIYNMESGDDRKKAESYGIYPVRVMERNSDEVKESTAYMGAVILHGDLVEKINEITYIEGLEYRLTTAIDRIRSKVNAFAGLNGQMKVTLYQSSGMSHFGIQNYSKLKDEISDVFERINADNRGKMKFEYSVLLTTDESLRIAEQFGALPVRWQGGKSGSGGIIEAGTGVNAVVVSTGGKFRTITIPLVRNLFGYVFHTAEIEKKIRAASDSLLSKNKVIAYVTGHGEIPLDSQNGELPLKSVNSDIYNFIEIDLSKEIPDGVDALIVNGPKTPYSDEELFRLDQFIMKGGSAVFFIDSFLPVPSVNGRGFDFIPSQTGIHKLLSSYGITVNNDWILDKNCAVGRTQDMGEITLSFVPLIEKKTMNGENPVTEYLNRMSMAKASSISVDEEIMKSTGVKTDVLLMSSDNSWLMKDKVYMSPYMSPPEDGKYSSYNMALTAEGEFSSCFPDGVNQKEKEASGGIISPQTPALKKGVLPARIAVVSSSEITTPNLVNPAKTSSETFYRNDDFVYYDNGVFLHNLIDFACGTDEYSDMRSKGASYSPVSMGTPLFRNTVKIFNMVGIPILIVLTGSVVLFYARRRSRSITAEYSAKKEHSNE